MIRQAGPDDETALAGLRRAWTEELAGGPVDDPGYEAAFAAWFERERDLRVGWLAEHDGRAVGMLNLLVFHRMPRPRAPEAEPPARQWGYVANVYVLPDHRGRGTGTELLAAATAHADEHGFARLVLSPSEQAVSLYERAGFGPATSLLLRPGR